MSNCINSSKVYCKSFSLPFDNSYNLVLIVAKCIVNFKKSDCVGLYSTVLIVAKCIVNVENYVTDVIVN